MRIVNDTKNDLVIKAGEHYEIADMEAVSDADGPKDLYLCGPVGESGEGSKVGVILYADEVRKVLLEAIEGGL